VGLRVSFDYESFLYYRRMSKAVEQILYRHRTAICGMCGTFYRYSLYSTEDQTACRSCIRREKADIERENLKDDLVVMAQRYWRRLQHDK
jgi:hypothetical protein